MYKYSVSSSFSSHCSSLRSDFYVFLSFILILFYFSPIIVFVFYCSLIYSSTFILFISSLSLLFNYSSPELSFSFIFSSFPLFLFYCYYSYHYFYSFSSSYFINSSPFESRNFLNCLGLYGSFLALFGVFGCYSLVTS